MGHSTYVGTKETSVEKSRRLKKERQAKEKLLKKQTYNTLEVTRTERGKKEVYKSYSKKGGSQVSGKTLTTTKSIEGTQPTTQDIAPDPQRETRASIKESRSNLPQDYLYRQEIRDANSLRRVLTPNRYAEILSRKSPQTPSKIAQSKRALRGELKPVVEKYSSIYYQQKAQKNERIANAFYEHQKNRTLQLVHKKSFDKKKHTPIREPNLFEQAKGFKDDLFHYAKIGEYKLKASAYGILSGGVGFKETIQSVPDLAKMGGTYFASKGIIGGLASFGYGAGKKASLITKESLFIAYSVGDKKVKEAVYEYPFSTVSKTATEFYLWDKSFKLVGSAYRKGKTVVKIATGKAKVISETGQVTFGKTTFQFKPTMSERATAKQLLTLENQPQKLIHVSQGGIKTDITGKAILKGDPLYAEGWRAKTGSLNTYFSPQSFKSGLPHGNLGYIPEVNAIGSASSSPARFTLFKPKNFAYVTDDIIRPLPRNLKSVRAINQYIAQNPNQFTLTGENLFGKSLESQVVASAQFEYAGIKSTGSVVKIGGNIGTAIYNQPYAVSKFLKLNPKTQFAKFFTHKQIEINLKSLSFAKDSGKIGLISSKGSRLNFNYKELPIHVSSSAKSIPLSSSVASVGLTGLSSSFRSSSTKPLESVSSSRSSRTSPMLSRSSSLSSRSSSLSSSFSSSSFSSGSSGFSSSFSSSSFSSGFSGFSSSPSPSRSSSSGSSLSLSSSSSGSSSLSSDSSTKTPPLSRLFLFKMGSKSPNSFKLSSRKRSYKYTPSLVGLTIGGKRNVLAEKMGFGVRG